MAKIYFRKITERAVNPATGCVWELDDVPAKWQNAVSELLFG